MLEIDALEAAYGDAIALWGVSLRVGERELVSVVGPNGSGKTTLINTIAGLLRPRAGRLRFGGEDLARLIAAGGRNVVLVARSADKLQALAGQLAAAHGIEATVLAADLSQPDAAAHVAAALGRWRERFAQQVNA